MEDFDWLLEDASARVESESRIAINTALQIWRSEGSPMELLKKLSQLAQSNALVKQAYDAWTQPAPPSSMEQIAQVRRLDEIKRRNEADRTSKENSWLEFASKIREESVTAS